MAEKRRKTSVVSKSKSSKSGKARTPARNKVAAKAPARKATLKTAEKAAAKAAVRKTVKPSAAPAARKKTAAVAVIPRASKAVGSDALKVVESALEELKAVNVRILDVRKLTDVADVLVIASGNSDRHVRSIADRVVADAKKAGFRPVGVEGERDGEWVLVDLQDVIVHIMLPRIREFYRLENLWDVSAARREAAELAAGR